MNCNELKAGGFLVSKIVRLGRNAERKTEYAMATLTLQVGENQRVDIEMFANKLNASGQESKLYTNLMTIKNEYKSLDSQFVDKRFDREAKAEKDKATTVGSIEECDFVFANKGIRLSMNHYMKDNELQSNFRLSTQFVNRAKDGQNTPYLEGNLIGVVSKSGVELEDENGNSYVQVELTVPEYREAYGSREESVVVDKFTLYLKDQEQEAIDYCMSIFSENNVCCLGVEPLYKIVTEAPKEPQEKRGFGKISTFAPNTKVVRELRIVGGYDLDPAEFETDKAFDTELYSKGLAEYEAKMEALMSQKGKEGTVVRGFGNRSQGNVPF